MTNNNYYTPELEDFYIGYEYEFKVLNTNNWRNFKFLIDDEFDYTYYFEEDLAKNYIRVKYLDSIDIESLGFKYKETIRDGQYFTKDNLGLIYIKEDNILMIYKVIEDINQNEMLFQGNCKSINELKKIIKYLGY